MTFDFPFPGRDRLLASQARPPLHAALRPGGGTHQEPEEEQAHAARPQGEALSGEEKMLNNPRH